MAKYIWLHFCLAGEYIKRKKTHFFNRCTVYLSLLNISKPSLYQPSKQMIYANVVYLRFILSNGTIDHHPRPVCLVFRITLNEFSYVMMTSSNGNILRVTGPLCGLLAISAGNLPVTGEFPSQRSVTRIFDIFLDVRLNERLSKQSRRGWFETQSSSFCRHCNVIINAKYTVMCH